MTSVLSPTLEAEIPSLASPVRELWSFRQLLVSVAPEFLMRMFFWLPEESVLS